MQKFYMWPGKINYQISVQYQPHYYKYYQIIIEIKQILLNTQPYRYLYTSN